MEGALLQLFVLFTASAIAVPFAKKIGLGSVLGYLIAGIIIGPYGLSLLADVETLMHFTEFGVVIMLFLVGLELKPSLLWEMRAPIFGMGGMQVLLTALATGLFASIFVPWEQATAIGLILALSSTALVLQTLKENKIEMASSEVTMIPQTYVELTDESAIKNIQRILDLLDEDDDVHAVYSNWDE